MAEPFRQKERAIAEHLVTEHGAMVHRRPEDHTTYRKTNPDALVRYDGADPGRLTEFKTLTEATTSAVKRDIIDAAKQLSQHGGGDAVIDGRQVHLGEDVVRQGYARAAGQAQAHGQAMPRRARVILSGGRTIDLGEG
ncbi:MAG: hypothetical protein ACRDT6_04925 [Micromonosporaceae bacterium]